MKTTPQECLKVEEFRRSTARGRRIADTDAAFVEMHIARCAQCRTDFAVTRAFVGDAPAVERSEQDRRRLIATILNPADTEQAEEEYREEISTRSFGGRRLWWSVAAGLAAACVAAVLVVSGRPDVKTTRVTESFAAIPTKETTSPPTQQTWHTGSQSQAVELSDGIAVLLEADSTATLARRDDTAIVLKLAQGSVLASVDPNRKKKTSFSVTSRLGTVTVKGTVFRVSDSDGESTTEVLRGVVRAERVGGVAVDVSVGKRFSFKDGSLEDLLEARTAALEASLDMLTREIPVQAIADSQDTDSSTPIVPMSPAGPRRSVAKERPPRPQTVSELIAEASGLRRRGDVKNAAERYMTLIEQYPKSEEATSALVTLGKMQLHTLGNPREALGNFERYLQSGNRTLREEALFGRAEALRKVGRIDEEREALEGFLREFPGSLQATAIQNRLSSLKK